MQDSFLLFMDVWTTPRFLEGLVGKNPTYPMYQASARSRSSKSSELGISAARVTEQTQVGGSIVAATLKARSLVFALCVVLLLCIFRCRS